MIIYHHRDDDDDDDVMTACMLVMKNIYFIFRNVEQHDLVFDHNYHHLNPHPDQE
jgi:hypothetical protein